jgi:hypothetical protein
VAGQIQIHRNQRWTANINEDHPAKLCFDGSKGYGFVETDRECDGFVHFSAFHDRGDNGFAGSGRGE